MKNQKRALRRHQREHIKARIRRFYFVARGYTEAKTRRLDASPRRLGMLARTQKECSCSCCGNPRNAGWGEDKTVQERKQHARYLLELQAYRSEIDS